MIVEISRFISIIVEIVSQLPVFMSACVKIFLFVLGIKKVCDFDIQCNRYCLKLKQCR
nr:MAG TPA: hypothetical protein [Caudoviricetes sp.]